MRFAVLLLIGASLCCAQDARSLVARAVAADDHSDRLARDYTYTIRNEIRALDDAGQVKAVQSTLDEVLYIGGKRYFRPLEKNGKPVPDSEKRKEQEKLDRAAAEASRMSETEHDKRLAEADRERAKNRAQYKEIPDAFDFKLLGDTVIAGRPAYQIAATPRADYHGELGSVLRNVQGTLWIDKQDFNWVRIEADVLKSFSLGWFLARIAGGTHLSYEMMRVGSSEKDALWVPKDVSLKASARFALLKKVNVEQNVTFGGYRRFQTDSRIVSVAEEP